MIKILNRHLLRPAEVVIDLTAALEGPLVASTPPEPPDLEPPVLDLHVEPQGHHWVLCVDNVGDTVARHLVVRAIEPVGSGATAGLVRDSSEPVHLRPDETAEYRLFLPPGCAPGVRCQVTWRDGGGQHVTYHDVGLLSSVR